MSLRSGSLIPHSAVLVALVLAGSGCATPKGELFPMLTPARVWPPPPDTPRIELVGELSSSEDLRAGRSGSEALAALFRGERPPIKFSSPHAIAVGGSGDIAVADGSASAVHILELTSREHTVVSGFENDRFETPVGVVWIDQRLFVSDAGRHEIVELTESGDFVRRFGSETLARPVGIAYAQRSSRLYVVDGDAHHIALFDPNGQLIGTIGQRGEQPGEFNYPSHLCIRGDRLVVADTGNFRVQVLDLDGHPIRTIGHKGDGAGDFALPKGVAMDGLGRIFVVDAQFENVQIFDESGQLLMAFGNEGRSPGEFWLPAGLAVDAQDRIWVADSGNRRIQLFSQVRTAS